MTTVSSHGGGWLRLLVYAVLLVFLAALLYREASLGRQLGSLPVLLVFLAGTSHVLAGIPWRQEYVRRLFGWATWACVGLGAILSMRLMLPI